MKHTHVLRLLGFAGAALFAMSAHAEVKLAPANVPGPKIPVQKPLAAPVAPLGAGDAQLGMALLAAQVSGAGTVNFGSGATGALKLGTGTYEVQFNRDVTQCFYNAVSFGDSQPVFAQPRTGNPNGVFIEFENDAGTFVDSQFYLTVYCAR